MTHFAEGLVVRDGSNKPHPDRWQVGAYGELFIDDGTGWVAAGADPAAEIVDATPVKVARLLHVTADAAERSATTNGRLTVQIPGDYRVLATGNCLNTGAADTFHIEVFKKGAVVADAAATPGGEISCDVCAVGTAAQSWALQGVLPDMKVGDYVDLRVTGAGTNTPAIRQMRFGLYLIGDNSEPGEPTT